MPTDVVASLVPSPPTQLGRGLRVRGRLWQDNREQCPPMDGFDVPRTREPVYLQRDLRLGLWHRMPHLDARSSVPAAAQIFARRAARSPWIRLCPLPLCWRAAIG